MASDDDNEESYAGKFDYALPNCLKKDKRVETV